MWASRLDCLHKIAVLMSVWADRGCQVTLLCLSCRRVPGDIVMSITLAYVQS